MLTVLMKVTLRAIVNLLGECYTILQKYELKAVLWWRVNLRV